MSRASGPEWSNLCEVLHDRIGAVEFPRDKDSEHGGKNHEAP